MTSDAPKDLSATGGVPRWMQRGNLFMWTAVTAGIWLWLIHLIATASLVEYSCTHDEQEWTMHGLTAGLGLLTAIAGWFSYKMMQAGAEPEDAASVSNRTLFLGRLGLLTNMISLVAILLEGVFTVFISACV